MYVSEQYFLFHLRPRGEVIRVIMKCGGPLAWEAVWHFLVGLGTEKKVTRWQIDLRVLKSIDRKGCEMLAALDAKARQLGGACGVVVAANSRAQLDLYANGCGGRLVIWTSEQQEPTLEATLCGHMGGRGRQCTGDCAFSRCNCGRQRAPREAAAAARHVLAA